LRPSTACALLSVALALAGCAARKAPPVSPQAPDATAAIPNFEERALLLLMEDRRVVDPALVERFASSAAPVREMVAVALGRIGDPAVRPTLALLLLDG